MELSYPLDKIFITQHFGERPQIYKPLKGHDGIDFRTKFEDSPDGKRIVTCAAAGIVKKVGDQGTKGYGRYVRIEHPDGSETVYGHLTMSYIKPKQEVDEGEKLGVSGNTGFSSAPHLHFGYRPANYNSTNGFGGYIDPLPFLKTTPMSSANELHLPPLSLLKKKAEPGIYIYGYDEQWYGLHDMKILQILTGPYTATKVVVVDDLPSNLSTNTISLG